jgi:hypothetical protein
MSLTLILIILVLALAATTVFYAAHRPGPLLIKTVIAGVGFLVLFITLAIAGVL